MSPKIFTLREREDAKIQMLEAGFALIKQHGMTHASVEKVTKAVGLGKSTFYNFFDSKELFVYEIIKYKRDYAKQLFMETLGDREQMTTAEGKAFLRMIIFSEDSIYQYMTAEDEAKLEAALPPQYKLDAPSEAVIMQTLMRHMQGARKDADLHLIANLIKLMALAQFHKDTLHADALLPMLELMYTQVFRLVFEDEA